MRSHLIISVAVLVLFLLNIPAMAKIKANECYYDCLITDNNGGDLEAVAVRYENFGMGDSKAKCFKCLRGGNKLTYEFHEFTKMERTGEYGEREKKHIAFRLYPLVVDPFIVYISVEKSFLRKLRGVVFRESVEVESGELYNLGEIKTITFEHTGLRMQCPACGAQFFNSSKKSCPFDEEILMVVTSGADGAMPDDDLEELSEGFLAPVSNE